MEAVKEASETVSNKAVLGMHQRLKEMHDVALDSKPCNRIVQQQITDRHLAKTQTDELKELALEARNHLYKVFRDADLW